MILYSDKYLKELETWQKWNESVDYLKAKWEHEKNNISLFLKLSINTWYTLTLDGPEITLSRKEYDRLIQMLNFCFQQFSIRFVENNTCQWMFGYMMVVRTDLFFDTGLEYDDIEQMGKALILKSCKNDNLIAKLLYATDIQDLKSVIKYRKVLKEYIHEYFDVSQEVDGYFIEILTMY